MPRVAAVLTILLGCCFLDVCGYLIWVAVHVPEDPYGNFAGGVVFGAVVTGVVGLIIFFHGVDQLSKARPK